jgi:hypothetical protein
MQKTQEMQVQSLGLEEPLEEEVVTQSSNFAWRIPWTEEPIGILQAKLLEWVTTSYMVYM